MSKSSILLASALTALTITHGYASDPRECMEDNCKTSYSGYSYCLDLSPKEDSKQDDKGSLRPGMFFSIKDSNIPVELASESGVFSRFALRVVAGSPNTAKALTKGDPQPVSRVNSIALPSDSSRAPLCISMSSYSFLGDTLYSSNEEEMWEEGITIYLSGSFQPKKGKGIRGLISAIHFNGFGDSWRSQNPDLWKSHTHFLFDVNGIYLNSLDGIPVVDIALAKAMVDGKELPANELLFKKRYDLHSISLGNNMMAVEVGADFSKAHTLGWNIQYATCLSAELLEYLKVQENLVLVLHQPGTSLAAISTLFNLRSLSLLLSDVTQDSLPYFQQMKVLEGLHLIVNGSPEYQEVSAIENWLDHHPVIAEIKKAMPKLVITTNEKPAE